MRLKGREWIATGALLILAVGCGRRTLVPQQVYAEAEEAWADERYEDVVALIPDDATLVELCTPAALRGRFRLLQAKALAAGPDRRKGMAMLAAPIAGLDADDDRVRRREFGYQSCRVARSAEARQAGIRVLRGLLREMEPGSLEAAGVHLRLGTCLRMMSEFGSAGEAFREALAVARKKSDALLEAQTLSSMATVLVSLERFDEGVTHLRQAIRMSERAGTKGRHVRRRAMGNLGWCQFEVGDYERAKVTLSQVEPAASRERYINENNQARTLLALGDLEGAEQQYRKTLAAVEGDAGISDAERANLLLGLADVSLGRTDWEAAERWNRQAKGLLAGLPEAMAEHKSELVAAQIRMGKGEPGAAETALRQLLGREGVSPLVRGDAQMELGRALARQGRHTEAEAAHLDAIRVVEEGRGGLREAENRIAFGSGRIEAYRAAVRFYLERKRPAEALRVADRSRARGLREEAGRRRVEGTGLFYWLDEPASHLWVVPAAGEPAYFALPGQKELEGLVEAHNQFVLRARDPLTEGGREARRLYQALVAPAEKMLKGGRVWISPDGGLHALNFETLVAPGRERYWVEDAEISIVPGLTGPARTGGAGKGVLLAGDAVAGADAEFGELRHAGEELARIGARLGTAALRREAATPERVLAGLRGDPGVVHFAAHAVANRLRPLESSILLSPGAAGEGRLYAREIAGLKLRAKLVTLSACTAAGARQFRGEGLVGFAWAFLGAGAEGVVASLWEVDDASTPRLMEEMYGRLGAGRNAAAALREAKLALLQSGSALRKPYFWAAFQHFAR